MRQETQPSVQRAVSDPECFPVRLDAAKGTLAFVRAARSRLSDVSFLDGRYTLSEHPPFELSLKELLLTGTRFGAPWNFIFHAGFSCSTLLARCLDREGACLALKEPSLLNDLSEAKRLGLGCARDKRVWAETLSLALNLLFRHHAEDERVVVKASNADNGLFQDILTINPKARIFILTSDLKSFLLSVAKGGKSRREFVRRLLAAHAADENIAPLFPVPMAKVSGLDDLKAGAVLWHLQENMFQAVRRGFPGARLMFEDANALLANPADAVKQISTFFKVSTASGPLHEAALGNILSHHAKTPAFRYDADIRAAEFRAIEAYLGRALTEAITWGEALAGKKKALPDLKLAG